MGAGRPENPEKTAMAFDVPLVELVRATREVPEADAALALQCLHLADGLKSLGMKLLDGMGTDEDREAGRIMLRAELGVTEPDTSSYPVILCLHVAGWLEQGRSDGLDAGWVRRNCLALDAAFDVVPDEHYEIALEDSLDVVRAAADLVVGARRHMSAPVLVRSARNLRSEGRRVSQSSSQ